MAYESLPSCPIDDACKSQHLFRDTATGKVVKWRIRTEEFVPHVCMGGAVGISEKPEVAYMGEWLNLRTQRTRWVGPVRLRRTAMTPPPDNRWKQRGKEKIWRLVRIHKTKLNWEVEE